jgi:enamine deaminase RidA (YjgF/YER057c/UK114 family)
MIDEQRQSVSSGSPYEPVFGISRAVRIAQFIAVSGTAPLGSDGRTVAIGDAEQQSRRCLEIAQETLEKLGASLKDVIRTRILLTRIDDWEKVARVHGEFFSQVRPVSTVMQVSRFVDPDWLVEIEVDAVVQD